MLKYPQINSFETRTSTNACLPFCHPFDVYLPPALLLLQHISLHSLAPSRSFEIKLNDENGSLKAKNCLEHERGKNWSLRSLRAQYRCWSSRSTRQKPWLHRSIKAIIQVMASVQIYRKSLKLDESSSSAVQLCTTDQSLKGKSHSAGTSIASSSCPSNLSRGLVFPSFPLSVLTSLIAFVSFPFLMAGFSGRTFGSASATSRSVSLCILSSGIGAKASPDASRIPVQWTVGTLQFKERRWKKMTKNRNQPLIATGPRFEAALAALARDLSLPFESFFPKIVAGWLKAIVAKTLDRADFHIFPPKTSVSTCLNQIWDDLRLWGWEMSWWTVPSSSLSRPHNFTHTPLVEWLQMYCSKKQARLVEWDNGSG